MPFRSSFSAGINNELGAVDSPADALGAVRVSGCLILNLMSPRLHMHAYGVKSKSNRRLAARLSYLDGHEGLFRLTFASGVCGLCALVLTALDCLGSGNHSRPDWTGRTGWLVRLSLLLLSRWAWTRAGFRSYTRAGMGCDKSESSNKRHVAKGKVVHIAQAHLFHHPTQPHTSQTRREAMTASSFRWFSLLVLLVLLAGAGGQEEQQEDGEKAAPMGICPGFAPTLVRKWMKWIACARA